MYTTNRDGVDPSAQTYSNPSSNPYMNPRGPTTQPLAQFPQQQFQPTHQSQVLGFPSPLKTATPSPSNSNGSHQLFHTGTQFVFLPSSPASAHKSIKFPNSTTPITKGSLTLVDNFFNNEFGGSPPSGSSYRSPISTRTAGSNIIGSGGREGRSRTGASVDTRNLALQPLASPSNGNFSATTSPKANGQRFQAYLPPGVKYAGGAINTNTLLQNARTVNSSPRSGSSKRSISSPPSVSNRRNGSVGGQFTFQQGGELGSPKSGTNVILPFITSPPPLFNGPGGTSPNSRLAPHPPIPQMSSINMPPSAITINVKKQRHPSFHAATPTGSPLTLSSRKGRSGTNSPASQTQMDRVNELAGQGVSSNTLQAATPQQYIYHQLSKMEFLQTLIAPQGLQPTDAHIEMGTLEQLLTIPPELLSAIPDGQSFESALRIQDSFAESISQILHHLSLHPPRQQPEYQFASLDSLIQYLRDQSTHALLSGLGSNETSQQESSRLSSRRYSVDSVGSVGSNASRTSHRPVQLAARRPSIDYHHPPGRNYVEEFLHFLHTSSEAASIFSFDPRTHDALNPTVLELPDLIHSARNVGYVFDEHSVHILKEIAINNRHAFEDPSTPSKHTPYTIHSLKDLFELLHKISQTFQHQKVLQEFIQSHRHVKELIDFLPKSNLFTRKVVVTLEELKDLYFCCDSIDGGGVSVSGPDSPRHGPLAVIRLLKQINHQVDLADQIRMESVTTDQDSNADVNPFISESMRELIDKVKSLHAKEIQAQRESELKAQTMLGVQSAIVGQPFRSELKVATEESNPNDHLSGFASYHHDRKASNLGLGEANSSPLSHEHHQPIKSNYDSPPATIGHAWSEPVEPDQEQTTFVKKPLPSVVVDSPTSSSDVILASFDESSMKQLEAGAAADTYVPHKTTKKDDVVRSSSPPAIIYDAVVRTPQVDSTHVVVPTTIAESHPAPVAVTIQRYEDMNSLAAGIDPLPTNKIEHAQIVSSAPSSLSVDDRAEEASPDAEETTPSVHVTKRLPQEEDVPQASYQPVAVPVESAAAGAGAENVEVSKTNSGEIEVTTVPVAAEANPVETTKSVVSVNSNHLQSTMLVEEHKDPVTSLATNPPLTVSDSSTVSSPPTTVTVTSDVPVVLSDAVDISGLIRRATRKSHRKSLVRGSPGRVELSPARKLSDREETTPSKSPPTEETTPAASAMPSTIIASPSPPPGESGALPPTGRRTTLLSRARSDLDAALAAANQNNLLVTPNKLDKNKSDGTPSPAMLLSTLDSSLLQTPTTTNAASNNPTPSASPLSINTTNPSSPTGPVLGPLVLPALTNDTELVLDIQCERLDQMHLLKKASPFLEILLCTRTDVEFKKGSTNPFASGKDTSSTKSSSGVSSTRGNFFESVYKTETQRTNLNPIFRRIIVSAQNLCQMDYDRLLLFRVWDDSRDGDNQPMGECQTTLRELMMPLYENWPQSQDALKVPLTRPEKKGSKGYTNSGFIVFTTIVRYKQIERIPSKNFLAPSRRPRAGRRTMEGWQKKELENVGTQLKSEAAPAAAATTTSTVTTPTGTTTSSAASFTPPSPARAKSPSSKTDPSIPPHMARAEAARRQEQQEKAERKHRRDNSSRDLNSNRERGSSRDLNSEDEKKDKEKEKKKKSKDSKKKKRDKSVDVSSSGVDSDIDSRLKSMTRASIFIPKNNQHYISAITLGAKGLPTKAWYQLGTPNPFITIYAKQSIVEAYHAKQQVDQTDPNVLLNLTKALTPHHAKNPSVSTSASPPTSSSNDTKKEIDVWIPMWTSEIKHDSTSPEWEPFVLDVSALSNGDWDAPIQLSVSYSSSDDKIKDPNLLGSSILSLREFLTGSAQSDDSVSTIDSGSISITGNQNQNQVVLNRTSSKLGRSGTLTGDALAKEKKKSKKSKRPEIPIFKPGDTSANPTPIGTILVRTVVLLESLPGPKPRVLSADFDQALHSFHQLPTAVTLQPPAISHKRSSSGGSKSELVITPSSTDPTFIVAPIQPSLDVTRRSSFKRFSTISSKDGSVFVGSSGVNGGDTGDFMKRASFERTASNPLILTQLNNTPAPAVNTVASPQPINQATTVPGTQSTSSKSSAGASVPIVPTLPPAAAPGSRATSASATLSVPSPEGSPDHLDHHYHRHHHTHSRDSDQDGQIHHHGHHHPNGSISSGTSSDSSKHPRPLNIFDATVSAVSERN